ncbi:branched-chain amino acid aminotransferase [Pseudoalteromonas rubra]|uniref:Branched-chain-amino-acid aminotransferase n=1 Tax=Pseudoalteromonas rubra TaxID=43658 RepID=A0A5S3WTB7_9GAMM|nr:branched-chain amino acid transaminase [Pseudoalteromonas rubra]TMP31441.1 branched-chain amino acid aminotransferase [Pseudoalteromonas rubra]TMP34526.1 branched-chain amino acid aminotransferase [Pseudoalteromonas rubra]
MSKTKYIWHKGKIVDFENATIHVLSPTSQFGANVFEGLRGYWSSEEQNLYIFKMEEHIQRLKKSIKLIGFDSTLTDSDFRQSVIDVLTANDFKEDIAVRQTVYLDGFGSWMSDGDVEMFVAPVAKGRNVSGEKFNQGIKCMVSSWERISDRNLSPRIKLGANYMNSRLGQIEAVDNGYNSAIFLNSSGTVSEAPGACLFIVRDGKLVTPPLTSSVLESITRETVIHLAKSELGLEVEEREVDRTELYIAQEAFICGTAAEITPVTQIDRYEIGEGTAGPITRSISELYFACVRGRIEQYKHWLTAVY